MPKTCRAPSSRHAGQHLLRHVDLRKDDYEEFYNGFANRVLWPILHYRLDLAEFTRRDLGGYFRVNEFFAPNWTSASARRHDLGARLSLDSAGQGASRARPQQPHRLLHPYPVSAAGNPDCVAQPRPADPGAVSFDLVGFQTEIDATNFSRYLANECGLRRVNGGALTSATAWWNRRFPVGVETEAFERLARRASNPLSSVKYWIACQAGP